MIRKLLLVGAGFVLGFKTARALDFDFDFSTKDADSTATASDSIDQADARRMSKMVREAIENENVQARKSNDDAR